MECWWYLSHTPKKYQIPNCSVLTLLHNILGHFAQNQNECCLSVEYFSQIFLLLTSMSIQWLRHSSTFSFVKLKMLEILKPPTLKLIFAWFSWPCFELTQAGFLFIPIVSCGVGVEHLISKHLCITSWCSSMQPSVSTWAAAAPLSGSVWSHH